MERDGHDADRQRQLDGDLPRGGRRLHRMDNRGVGRHLPLLARRDREKVRGGAASLPVETAEGAALIRAAAARAGKGASAKKLLTHAEAVASATDPAALLAAGSVTELTALMSEWPDRFLASTYAPLQRVRVDRQGAGFAAWYEFFPARPRDTPITVRHSVSALAVSMTRRRWAST